MSLSKYVNSLIISDINEGSESSEHQIQSQIHRLHNKHTLNMKLKWLQAATQSFACFYMQEAGENRFTAVPGLC